jgi:hypothetical protein
MDNNKIPEDYFERKPKEVLSAIAALQDNIDVNAPLLYRYGKKEGYTVPANYFDDFYSNMQITKKSPSIRFIRFPRLTVAASLLALVTVGWLFMKDLNPPEDDLQLAEVYDYYIDNVEQIDQQLIYELSAEYADINDLESFYTPEEELNIIEETIIEDMTDQEFLDLLL